MLSGYHIPGSGLVISPQNIFDCYYAQYCGKSVMSYDQSNVSNSKSAALIPGSLLGDDREDIAKNKLVFPDFYFLPEQDYDTPPCKRGCPPHDKISRPLGQGSISLFTCYTGFGEIHGTKITNLNDHYNSRRIAANNAATGFQANTMWHSDNANDKGWVSFEITFAVPVLLNRIKIYTQHSGKYHEATAIQVEYLNNSGTFEAIKQVSLPAPNGEISFSPQKTNRWKIALKAGNSKQVVVRGIRFFLNDDEIFAPITPEIRTAFGEAFKSKLTNLVATQRFIQKDLKGVGFNPKSMWHSGKVNEKGWVSIELSFPEATTLNTLFVYSRHSKKYHPVYRVQIEILDATGKWKFITQKKLFLSIVSPYWFNTDAKVSFTKQKAKYWKLSFQGAKGGHVVIRGLRFLNGNKEYFPAGTW